MPNHSEINVIYISPTDVGPYNQDSPDLQKPSIHTQAIIIIEKGLDLRSKMIYSGVKPNNIYFAVVGANGVVQSDYTKSKINAFLDKVKG